MEDETNLKYDPEWNVNISRLPIQFDSLDTYNKSA